MSKNVWTHVFDTICDNLDEARTNRDYVAVIAWETVQDAWDRDFKGVSLEAGVATFSAAMDYLVGVAEGDTDAAVYRKAKALANSVIN